MRYFRFSADTPYAGTHNFYYDVFEDNVTEEELADYADECAINNGGSYEYLIAGWGNEPEEELDDYYAECYCTYEEITEADYYRER